MGWEYGSNTTDMGAFDFDILHQSVLLTKEGKKSGAWGTLRDASHFMWSWAAGSIWLHLPERSSWPNPFALWGGGATRFCGRKATQTSHTVQFCILKYTQNFYRWECTTWQWILHAPIKRPDPLYGCRRRWEEYWVLSVTYSWRFRLV
jgi:hypothetical protein